MMSRKNRLYSLLEKSNLFVKHPDAVEKIIHTEEDYAEFSKFIDVSILVNGEHIKQKMEEYIAEVIIKLFKKKRILQQKLGNGSLRNDVVAEYKIDI